ncbi:hypothetical protein AB0C59_10675 [Streptomyces sp. NPDC048664]|uniref:hypothetical protein n=1 Tax=Streptomyces sp. NPDC048664 TaxID=3154505 RepID=UPI00344147BE
MAGMTAIVLHDLGARAEARRWFSSAAAAGQEYGDRQLLAWLRARETVVPLNYSAPQAAATLAATVAARAYALPTSPSGPAKRSTPPTRSWSGPTPTRAPTPG